MAVGLGSGPPAEEEAQEEVQEEGAEEEVQEEGAEEEEEGVVDQREVDEVEAGLRRGTQSPKSI